MVFYFTATGNCLYVARGGGSHPEADDYGKGAYGRARGGDHG